MLDGSPSDAMTGRPLILPQEPPQLRRGRHACRSDEEGAAQTKRPGVDQLLAEPVHGRLWPQRQISPPPGRDSGVAAGLEIEIVPRGAMLKIFTSDRVFVRNTGGNTTYAREVLSRLDPNAFEHVRLAPPRLPGAPPASIYALWEGLFMEQSVAKRDSGEAVVHFTADTGPLRWGSRLPLIGTIHGVASRHIEGVRSRRQEAIWRYRVGRLAHLADAIISVSYSSQQDIASLWPKVAHKIRVIPHGIDHGRFHPEVSPAALDRLELPDEYLLFLGNLDPRKNVRALVAAVRRPEVRRLGIPLVVAGAPAWRDADVVTLLRETPGVIYLGAVDDDVVAPLIARAVAFVFPSRYEGFGLPVLEAMACGTPVVTTDRGALKEVAGKAALICDPEPGAIADALVQLLSSDSLQSQLRRTGLARAAEFHWRAAVQRHEELYVGVARTGRVARSGP